MSQIEEISFFPPNFAIWQIRECWFQIWQYSFQIPVKKYWNNTFLIPKLDIFGFPANFAIRLIWGCLFKTWQYCFQVPVQKHPNEAFLVPNLGRFFFSKFCNYTNLMVLTSKMTILFSSSSPEMTKKDIFCPKFSIFISPQNLAIRRS